MKITVPTTLSDITWGDYLKYKAVMEAEGINENIERLALVSIFCKLTVAQAQQIPFKELNQIAAQINSVLASQPRFIQRFILNGKEFGFIPNLDQMTAGEYIDIDKYIFDDETRINALAVLYRPVLKKKRWRNWISRERESLDVYAIEKYEGSAKYAEQMNNVSLEVAKGCEVFFYTLGSELLKAMTGFIRNDQTANKLMKEASSLVNGDGIKASTLSLDALSSILKRQQSLVSINSLLSSNSRRSSRKKKKGK